MVRMASPRLAPSLLLVLLSTVASAQTAPTLHMVEMRDGVTLATDVYLPSGGAAVPILLRQTPYGRALDPSYVTQVLGQGYGLVSQDVRGRGDSGGVYLPFNDAANDGFDTIGWIAAQPWSNGKVGMVGMSAEGIVQLYVAAQATPPPALKCAHVGVATADMYEALLQGGAWRGELGNGWLQGLMEPAALAEVRQREVLDAFWDPVRLSEEELASVNIPILHIGGYFDVFARGTTRVHSAMQNSAVSGDSQFLILGPWTHTGMSATKQGEVTFPSSSTYAGTGFLFDMVNFFNWCLKGAARPTFADARYYVAELADDGTSASGGWRTGESWPPVSTPTSLYLHEDGELRTAAPILDDAPTAIPVDPMNPVPSIGGGNLTIAAGPVDQSELAVREDVLVVQTVPFTEAVELIGDVHARIWAASATDDVDVIVRIEQLTPSGKSILLADGARRGRFVQGFDAIRPLTPDTAALFDVDLGPVGVRVPAGHALRFSFSGTSSPRYEPNKNTAVPLSDTMTAPITTTLSVFHDPSHPSEVILPVVSGAVPTGSPVPTGTGEGADAGTSPGPASPGAGGDDGSGAGVEPTGCGCSQSGGSTSFAVGLMLLALLFIGRTGSRRPAPAPVKLRRSRSRSS